MTIVSMLEKQFEYEDDFISRNLLIGQTAVTILGLNSMIDFPRTVAMIRQQFPAEVQSIPVEDILANIGQVLSGKRLDEVLSEIHNGMLIVVHEPSRTAVSLSPMPKELLRPVSEPLNENHLLSPSSAFNEDLDTNIGLLRKHINSDNLHFATYTFGQAVKNRVTLAYLKDCIAPSLLLALTNRLESNMKLEVDDLQTLNKVLGQSMNSLVTHYQTSETPRNAVLALKQGKAVIFIDCVPFAVVIPSLISDIFMTDEDRNYPPFTSMLMRFYRIIGLLITLVIPGLYVSLVSVNPDVLRFELAHSIAKSRLQVPYPSLLETLLMMFILELLIEALIRLPSSIGPAITMVGGIVLGQAAVSAKLVSNLLIIVLAAVTIASSTLVSFHNSYFFRLFKYLLICLSALFGVIGLMAGLVVMCAYLAGEKTFDIPYLQLKKPEGE